MPVVAEVDDLGRRAVRAAEQRGGQLHGRLGVVRTAALLEQAGFSSSVGSAYSSSSSLLDLGHLGGAGLRRPQLAHHLVVGVEVAQVVRRDDAERRAAGPAGSSMRSAMLGDVPLEQLGQPVDAVDAGRALPGQVVEPDVVELAPARARRRGSRRTLRWKPMATLHSPTARWPACSRARVTMPTGLVKSMIQASGAAAATCSAMSRTTGTVRSAFASPPAPVVSCPTQPHSSGQVSSW